MFTGLTFLFPWMLGALVAVPVLWWLLRVMPPRPRRIEFPPTRLLFDIAPKEQQPARTPWWLTLLRLLLAALGVEDPEPIIEAVLADAADAALRDDSVPPKSPIAEAAKELREAIAKFGGNYQAIIAAIRGTV